MVDKYVSISKDEIGALRSKQKHIYKKLIMKRNTMYLTENLI